jgi:hypothetical protein
VPRGRAPAPSCRTSADADRLAAAVDPAVAEPALVVGIAVAASRDWHAAAWILERRFPQRWGAGRVAADDDDDSRLDVKG